MSKRTPVATQEHDTSANAPAIPEPGQGKRGEEGYLGYLLRQASAAQRLRMERAMADVGVTLPQFLVLTMLRAYPGISNADLARLTMLTPQTVSVIVTNLERSGAITRRPHAVHGRIQHIDVTPEGSALLAACRKRSGGIEQDLLEGFTPEEEEVVRRWLVHVAKLGSDKPTS
ncbi:MAG: MarR family transcriptional regulator [Ralstonia sp.]|uniref:MarR family transcriptional regulator n=1 Tax=Ralstonia pickettii TaxID=329 RepID=A0A9Q3QNQ5_RALPI|nr:MarR family transcriptional regulator [Ralstonia pickettii]MBA9847344.1 MarR family transcriptional regulator [Ralstonia pickettii]MBA9849535.1 MarR family transcriptional regulator [Ralstonia pickettii]MBA9879037.1 MarR family transcriptional regulator [Ralstonia pickettii]MBA9883920.1 MarR family transcriptional regulator [Ralstonia pickettii]MBA9885750.1 MarR family transcriptional regulator [Ralstonia pickettii]